MGLAGLQTVVQWTPALAHSVKWYPFSSAIARFSSVWKAEKDPKGGKYWNIHYVLFSHESNHFSLMRADLQSKMTKNVDIYVITKLLIEYKLHKNAWRRYPFYYANMGDWEFTVTTFIKKMCAMHKSLPVYVAFWSSCYGYLI